MPLQVLQRMNWNGRPVEMGDWFILHKNRRPARAAIFSHVLGWELRLLVESQDEMVRTQVCRTQEEVSTTGEEWKAALVGEGWKP